MFKLFKSFFKAYVKNKKQNEKLFTYQWY